MTSAVTTTRLVGDNVRLSRHMSGEMIPGRPMSVRMSSDGSDKAPPFVPPLLPQSALRLVTSSAPDGQIDADFQRATSSPRRPLITRLSADVDLDRPLTARFSGGLHRPLVSRMSGELLSDPSRGRVDSNDSQRGYFATNGADRSPSQKFSPRLQTERLGSQRGLLSQMESPRLQTERLGSQRGLGSQLDSPRDMIRVVSQRALTSQVAKTYLQTIEQQKLQREKSIRAREEAELLNVRKKTAMRLLGSFSMYQVDSAMSNLRTQLEEEEVRPPPVVARVSSLGQKPLTPPGKQRSLSQDVLEDEYETSLMAIINRRELAKAFLMWRTVVSYRKFIKAKQQKQKMRKLPAIAFGRRRSRRPPAPAAPNQRSRASRMSVVRRPSADIAELEQPRAEWFDLEAGASTRKDQHRHQLNLGRRNTRVGRLSVAASLPSGMGSPQQSSKYPSPSPRTRKSTIKSGPAPGAIPPAVPEHDIDLAISLGIPIPSRSPIMEEEMPVSKEDKLIPSKDERPALPKPSAFTGKRPSPVVRAATSATPPPPAVMPTSLMIKQPKGLQRKMSWGKKGMDAIKSMFTAPGNRLLARIPSKEKLLIRTSSKERMVE